MIRAVNGSRFRERRNINGCEDCVERTPRRAQSAEPTETFDYVFVKPTSTKVSFCLCFWSCSLGVFSVIEVLYVDHVLFSVP